MLSETDRYFLTVVKCKTLRAAAEELYVSQPSLTKYIQRIEAKLGTTLFDRSCSPMRLTNAGNLYYQFLLEQCKQEEQFVRHLADLNPDEVGVLRIGIPMFSAQHYLPNVVVPFINRYPSVKFKLFEETGANIEKKLLNDEIDIGVLHLSNLRKGFVSERIFADSIYLAAPAAGNKQIVSTPNVYSASVHDFRERLFMFPSSEQKIGIAVTKLFSENHISPQVLFSSQNTAMTLQMVSNGVGCCFVPKGTLYSNLSLEIINRVDFYSLAELESLSWDLNVVYRENNVLPAYTNYFIELLQGIFTKE